jgi:serine/threonine protein phosphatase PrpC
MPHTIQAWGGSDPGCARARNEDAWGLDPARGAALIADGMGGAAAGEVASRTVVETLTALLAAAARVPDDIELRHLFATANARVLAQADTQPAWTGMGSTALLACWDDAGFVIAHVGDCRAYLWRDGVLIQLTTDHTLVAVLQAEHGLSAAAARTHPLRHQLLASLGTAVCTPPSIHRDAWQAGDRLLLCSDGLWEVLGAEALQVMLARRAPPQQAVSALLAAALAAGAPDNVTAIVIKVDRS